MISFRHLSLRRGSRLLLEDVNWTLYQGQHIGLTGANGAGKSSLFSLLLNELSPDMGEIETPAALKMVHVAQEMPHTTLNALEFVIDGDTALRAIQSSLEEAQVQNDGFAIAHAHEALHRLDAWTAPTRAAKLLEGLGFKSEEITLPVKDFSGGWQMRLLLAQALMSPSDMLLLDEPTNHLDLDAVIWLTRWLKNYPGTLLMISHDRDFLDETVQYIAHIDNKTLTTNTGNYSAFEKYRAERKLEQAAAFRKQQLQVSKLNQFINRFRAKASKAKQAQSRIKALARLEIIAAVREDSPFTFEFREPAACPNPLLQLDEVTIAYGTQVVLKNINFSVTGGDRIALIGPNGAGKTSLIRVLAGELAETGGERIVGRGLTIGYFAQHHVNHLLPDETPLQHLSQLAPELMERQLRGWLGSFGFSGDRVHDKVGIFSGGEKSRLALALIIWKKPNLLLLDEPTNHLDMEMRDALGFALQTFQGAVVLVSHDRFLVRSTMDKLILVANNVIEEFNGDLSAYENWLIDFRREQTTGGQGGQKAKRKKNAREINRLESQINKVQNALKREEAKLLTPEWQDFNAREKLASEMERCEKMRAELTELEEKWLIENDEGK